MIRLRHAPLILGLFLLFYFAYERQAPSHNSRIIRVKIPNPLDAYKPIQTALLTAKPGQIVELPTGRFDLYRGLSLATPKVTLRGQGMHKTILSFKGQIEAAQGFRMTSSGGRIEKLQIIDTPGNAMSAEGVKNVVFSRIFTTWSPRKDDLPKYQSAKKECPNASPQNGSYGFYPVMSENVIVEHSQSSGASDSGIYIGQSSNVIIRHNRVWCNVAGIEVENSQKADVHDNVVTLNTGGILLFRLPLLPMQYGSRVRVFRNKIYKNNTLNFAPKGATVGMTPDGAGMMIVANQHIEIFNNTFHDLKSFGVMNMSYLLVDPQVGQLDPKYQPFSNNIYIHGNTFNNIGYAPSKNPDFYPIAAALLQKLKLKRLPALLFDGSLPPIGKKEPKPCICERKNPVKPAGTCSTFVNFDIYRLFTLMALMQKGMKPGNPIWDKAWAAWKPSCDKAPSCQCKPSSLKSIQL